MFSTTLSMAAENYMFVGGDDNKRKQNNKQTRSGVEGLL